MTEEAIERFQTSTKWRETYGRISLPILVQLVESFSNIDEQYLPEFTYSDLAVAVNQPRHAHPIEHALGSIGDALKELNTRKNSHLGEIPPIQLIVWSKGQNSPGEDAFGFLGISKTDRQNMSSERRKALARWARKQILDYPHWRSVLSTLGLEPLVKELPPIEAITDAPDKDGFGGGESEFHKRLKAYVAAHPELIAVPASYSSSFEEILSSGDRVDLMFRDDDDMHHICVEVKSRISAEQDLIRGLFQCVKYQAVLEAEQKYHLAREPLVKKRTSEVMLVIESAISNEVAFIRKLLNVKVSVLVVPADFIPSQPHRG